MMGAEAQLGRVFTQNDALFGGYCAQKCPND